MKFEDDIKNEIIDIFVEKDPNCPYPFLNDAGSQAHEGLDYDTFIALFLPKLMEILTRLCCDQNKIELDEKIINGKSLDYLSHSAKLFFNNQVERFSNGKNGNYIEMAILVSIMTEFYNRKKKCED